MEEGKEPSPQLYEQPELFDTAIFYWNAFYDLSSDRSFGMGVGPIPYSSVCRYAEAHGMGRDEFDYFHTIIRAMDTEYLAIANKSKDEAEMIPITDVSGQREMFKRMLARQKQQK